MILKALSLFFKFLDSIYFQDCRLIHPQYRSSNYRKQNYHIPLPDLSHVFSFDGLSHTDYFKINFQRYLSPILAPGVWTL